ncbi:MAG: SpoIIE family protein phosphatase [Spirochaetales bacterium]|nr:SpoIIE family protein phosphatase [Spirochaetales bacterium]
MKFFTLFLISLYYRYISFKRPLPAFRFIKYITIMLLIRDVVYCLLRVLNRELSLGILDNGLFLLNITDSIVLLFYLYWLREYTGKRNHDISIFIINGFFALLMLLNIFLFKFYGTWYGYALFGIIVITIIYLSVNLIGVSIYNTENADIILLTKATLIIIPGTISIIIYLVLPFLPKLDSLVILQSLIYSLGYLLHIYIIYKYNELFDREQMLELKFISNDLESLFEYMRVLSTAIGKKQEQDEVLSYVIESTVKTTSAEAGVILKVDEYEDILKVKAVCGFFPPLYAVPEILIKQKISSLEAYFKSTPIRLGESILGEVAKSGKPRFIRQSRDEPLLSYNINNNTLYVNSVIIIPLVIQKRVLGVLAVLHRERGKVFSENDFEHLKTFGEYAALTIDFLDTYMEVIEKREMEKELEIAKDIQQKLLPKKIPRMNNVELQVFYTPVKKVSGDYYDIFNLKGDKIGIVICDVAGKGYPAAIVMVMIRSILHLITKSDREIATILTWVNRGIAGQIEIDHYATMSMFSFDEVSKELIYSNAAHHPLLIYRKKTNQIELLDTEGLPIGIEKTTRYRQKRAKLMSGDIITMYTDGIIEAMNLKGEQYSSERFHKLLLDNVDKSAKELIDLIKADLQVFVGNADQHDDQTLILMKVN